MAREGPDHTSLSSSSPRVRLCLRTSRPRGGVHMNLGVPQQREHKAGSAQGLMNHPGAAREQQGPDG